ncbi:hypothetical protein [Gordonia humi]|uniref:Transcriptional regulator, AbiEi antitoxin, Type IV TA system n=1 Tax=Gordonia humi TaxID=686429 RepID=A0A840F6Y9_9ACTN|nr:hypothetical protein [Gordonia humi]MBB4135990.1 hypothetical protein [Gordonia humi]
MWPEGRHGVIRRSDLIDTGMSDAEIKRRLRDCTLAQIEAGAYVLGDRLPKYDVQDAKYRLRALAAADTQSLPLSYDSAAAVHGLELLFPDHAVVHVSKPTSSGGRTMASRHIHTGLPDDSVVEVDGVLVSDLVCTAVDVAAGKPFPKALAALDSALRLGASREALQNEIDKRRRAGVAVVRIALRHADPLSANPGESWSRAQMIEAKLPSPVLQRRFDFVDGTIAYTDYCWGDSLAAEFDGLRKYWRDLKPGQNVEDAVVAEKIREDRLRDHVGDVARWIYDDLRSGAMIPMLRRRMCRAGIET